VAEEDDAGSLFFFGRQYAVAVGIEQSHDSVIGLLSVAVLENADVCIRGDGSANALGELNRAMVKIVVADKAADEANHNGIGG